MKKEFLAELNQNPIWHIIINEIKNDIKLPCYNPNDKKDSVSQEDRWKFVSGRQFEYDRICQILNIEDKS